ncbi:hypothetical protein MUK42_27917 [Musa troglodytarum]|uniref:Uncharacterized protein n=1 Tax=Musa troglodytarum TaxID=320322 RepID=A0A9E7G525_9LILI|nr:hypothetical protein MUK42_27917 [Musa troglodytarum]
MASDYEQFVVYQSRMGQAGLLAFWQEHCRCWTSHRTVRFNSSRHHSFGLARNFGETIPTTLLAPRAVSELIESHQWILAVGRYC